MKKIILILFAIFFLSSCEKKLNPLLERQYIGALKRTVDFLQSYPEELDSKKLGLSEKCPIYLSGFNESYSLKNDCNQWAEDVLKKMLNYKSIPYNTTLEQFKDPELWKAILPK